MKDPLFSGRESLRDSHERRNFVYCILALPFTLVTIAALFSEALTPARLVLIGIGALLYVSISRGRLLGDSIHVHGGQLANLDTLVAECARQLDVPKPQVFVRDDVQVPIVAVGVAEPYALVISSHWLAHLRDDELRFLISRELAHIRAGHTRISSVLSVNGRENALVSVPFGAYLRRTEYTADRVALCCVGSLESAIKATAIASYHHLGRTVDLAAIAEQLREIRGEAALRAGEWLGSSPYAARRISALIAFAQTDLAKMWGARFAEASVALPKQHIEAGSIRFFAGWWRRFGAWIVDISIVAMIFSALAPSIVQVNGKSLSEAFHVLPRLVEGIVFSSNMFYLWIYSILLVTAIGRTAGMMIFDVRVVNADLGRPTFWNVLARYTLGGLSLLTVFPIVVWGLRRIQPYETLSRTRLVSASAVLEPGPAFRALEERTLP